MPALPPARRDLLIAATLALASVFWMLSVEGRQGIGRDEAQYFRAAERYWGWFEGLWQNTRAGRPGASFTRAGIDAFWGDNPEHPPLMKVAYGLSWRALHRCECAGPERALHPIAIPIAGRHKTLPLFPRESTAFRFPALLMAGLGVGLVFLFARRFIGPLAAAGAAVLFLAQPHTFFHAQISCFDAPITVMGLALAFAWWKSLRSARWGMLCGVVYGLALATKHNAWLMPLFLLAHYLWIRRSDLKERRLPPFPLAFVSMATVGPLVLVALWPWLWPDIVGRTRGWLVRHLQHEHYNFEYLGLNWNLPPLDFDLQLLRATFPFVSSLFTVPVTTLALAAVGVAVLIHACRRRQAAGPTPDAQDASVPLVAPDAPVTEARSWRRPGADVDRSFGGLLAVHGLAPLVILAVPSTPIFGGVKHFMTAMPFWAMAAGVGLTWLLRFASRALRPRAPLALSLGLVVLLCLPAVLETRRSHPDGLSHYNVLAGGFAGGASLGMNRQFWGYSVLPLLPWMIEQRPASNAIYWHDVLGDALTMYARDGRLPPGIGNLGADENAIPRSDLGIVIHEKHFTLFEGRFWEGYGTTRPAAVHTREGVPLVTAYRRPSAP